MNDERSLEDLMDDDDDFVIGDEVEDDRKNQGYNDYTQFEDILTDIEQNILNGNIPLKKKKRKKK